MWQNDATQRVAVVWALKEQLLGWDWLAQDGVAGWSLSPPGLNGDSKPDLVFQNDARQVVVWYRRCQGGTFLDGLAVVNGVTAGASFTADFNGDGRPDLVFQGDARQVAVWVWAVPGKYLLRWDWLASTGVTGFLVVGAW